MDFKELIMTKMKESNGIISDKEMDHSILCKISSELKNTFPNNIEEINSEVRILESTFYFKMEYPVKLGVK